MKINGKHYHTIWLNEADNRIVQVIDQRKLPFCFEVFDMKTMNDACFAIKEMVVRGAPLIGVTAAFGMYLALLEKDERNIEEKIRWRANQLKATRPTAVNLAFAVDEMADFILKNKNEKSIAALALEKANRLKELEIEYGNSIGEYGVELISDIYHMKKQTVNILTHCNAGWLACIDWGTATAPIYKAHQNGIPVHVWVDETRPRNQGARLTAFELGEENVPHTVIADNTGGHLMQHGLIDLVIVGSDRATVTGDIANKIGTYLKALAAADNQVPFYAAFPSSTFDWNLTDGIREIPIEERDPSEVAEIEGWTGDSIRNVRLIPSKSKAANFGFDVTPSRLISGLITERGICKADKESIRKLFPEKFKQ